MRISLISKHYTTTLNIQRTCEHSWKRSQNFYYMKKFGYEMLYVSDLLRARLRLTKLEFQSCYLAI